MATIIFDFDGTIADSFDYVADFLASEAGQGHLDKAAKEKLRGLSVLGISQKLGFHWWEQPRLLIKGRRRMKLSMKQLRVFPGMSELIRKLHAEGHELFVLSSNTTRNVKYFLELQKIDNYFVGIYGGQGIINKAWALRYLLRRQSISKTTAVYVGDELRDVLGAKAAGMGSVAVTWGFASRKALAAAKPTAMADSSKELMRILEEI